jgi:ubiquinone/menaquinone biosynthesis C-methylase UbiE
MKLHLGCGERFIPGFVHVDAHAYPHVDHQAKAENLAFVENGSTDLLYASHLLEHYGRSEIEGVLSEWYRVLRPDGVLRLAVPDFEACAKLYYERGLEDSLIRRLIDKKTAPPNLAGARLHLSGSISSWICTSRRRRTPWSCR